MFRAPAVVVSLIALLIAAHGVRVLVPANLSAELVSQFAFIPARYSHTFLAAHNADPGGWLARACLSSAIWRCITTSPIWRSTACGFWHSGHRGAAFWRVSVSAVLPGLRRGGRGGAFGLQLGSPVPVIGASGAISGLMAAGLRLLPSQAPWANAGEEKMAPIFSRQIVVFTLVWMGINLAAGLTGLGVGGEAGLIAWQAHMGGYLAGLLLAAPFDRLRPRSQML